MIRTRGTTENESRKHNSLAESPFQCKIVANYLKSHVRHNILLHALLKTISHFYLEPQMTAVKTATTKQIKDVPFTLYQYVICDQIWPW